MNMMTAIIASPNVGPVPPIALLRALPPGPLAKEHERLNRLAELFAAFDRDDMEAGVELLLAELVARAGDTDLEPEEDRCAAYDDDLSDVRVTQIGFGADHPHDDDCCETSGWSEWHTRGRHKLTSAGTEERGTCDVLSSPRHEDEEDDDPREADGDEQDTGSAEDEDLDEVVLARVERGPGCAVSDPSEPTLGAPERDAGLWPFNMGSQEDGECEAWEAPPMMDGPMAANDQVPA